LSRFPETSQRSRWPLGGYSRDGLSHAPATRRDPPPYTPKRNTTSEQRCALGAPPIGRIN